MASDLVSVERQGGVAVLRIDRPPANAIDLELARQFRGVLEAVLDDGPEAVVLTGAGRFFSGGLDLRVVPTYGVAEQRELLRALNRMIGALYGCPIPVVGAINGHAVAGAFILALTADYRVGAEGDCVLGLTEARVGIPFPAAAMVVLQAELSPSDVRYTTLYARNFGPEEARERGVLDELQPAEAVVGRAIEVARDLASMPAEGYRRIKRQVREAALHRIEQLIATDSDPMLRGWLDPDAQKASAGILDRSRKG